MELFQFVNIETVNPEKESSEVPIRVTVAEGQAPARELRCRLRHRGARARRRRVPPRELPRRRPLGRHPRAVVVARSGRPARFQPAVCVLAALFHRRRRAALVDVHAGVRLDGDSARKSVARPPLDAEDVMDGVVRDRGEQQHDLGGGAERSDAARRPDRARPRPDDRASRKACRTASRSTSSTRPPTTC